MALQTIVPLGTLILVQAPRSWGGKSLIHVQPHGTARPLHSRFPLSSAIHDRKPILGRQVTECMTSLHCQVGIVTTLTSSQRKEQNNTTTNEIHVKWHSAQGLVSYLLKRVGNAVSQSQRLTVGEKTFPLVRMSSWPVEAIHRVFLHLDTNFLQSSSCLKDERKFDFYVQRSPVTREMVWNWSDYPFISLLLAWDPPTLLICEETARS